MNGKENQLCTTHYFHYTTHLHHIMKTMKCTGRHIHYMHLYICVLPPMYWLWMHSCTHRHGSVTYKPFKMCFSSSKLNNYIKTHVQNTIIHNLALLKLSLRSQIKTEIWSCHRDYNKNFKSNVSWNEDVPALPVLMIVLLVQ